MQGIKSSNSRKLERIGDASVTTTLYRNGDIIALKLKPEEAAGMVCQDQEPGKRHVKVHRTNQPAPELLHLDDIQPWHGGSKCEKH